MEDRQRVCRARLATDRDEHAAAGGERLKDPAVVRLKSDAPHRPGESKLRKVSRASLQRVENRPARENRADSSELKAFAGGAKRSLDEDADLARLFRNDREYVGRQAKALQRFQPLLRPRGILKYGNREPSSVDLGHELVMYHGGRRAGLACPRRRANAKQWRAVVMSR
jgi:hypothetical protein